MISSTGRNCVLLPGDSLYTADNQICRTKQSPKRENILTVAFCCKVIDVTLIQDVKPAGELSSTIHIPRVTGRSGKPSDAANTMVPSKRRIFVW